MPSRALFLTALLALGAPACAKRAEPTTDQLPADRIDEVLALQPGVVAGGPGLSIRGGRPDESVTYIDGVPVQAGSRGNGFEEASIATGPAAAEFGNAQSGVISVAAHRGPRAFRDSATVPSLLIRTGSTSLRVDSLEPAIAQIHQMVDRLGGYVGNTNYQGGEERRRMASLQLRIPATRFDELQAEVGEIGKVLSFNVQVADVGMEFTDAQARLRSKRMVEERLLQLLRTHVGKLSDVVELEQSLEEVRNEIEQTEGQLRYLRNQVALSTVMVTLMEPGLQVQEPGYHPIRDAFLMAWRNFTGFLAALIASLGWVLPTLGILWGIWKLIRTRRPRLVEQ